MASSVTAFNLKVALATAGFPPTTSWPYTSQADYAVPTLDYIQSTFYPWWLESLPGGLQEWQAKWECWQFTTHYLAMLQMANALTAASPTGTTCLSAGRWDFSPDPDHVKNWVLGEGHSIACLFTDQGVKCLDPQNNVIWTPSENELLSTRLLLF